MENKERMKIEVGECKNRVKIEYDKNDNELEKSFNDAQVFGTGVMKGGQHIPIKNFYKEIDNKDWMKKQSKQKQIEVYGKAYDLMTLRKAYHGEDLTVDEAITRIREAVAIHNTGD